jgi:hypothetical protein
MVQMVGLVGLDTVLTELPKGKFCAPLPPKWKEVFKEHTDPLVLSMPGIFRSAGFRDPANYARQVVGCGLV